MLAKDVMSKGVISIKADATVAEAAAILVNTRISAMPVLDAEGVMVGIVTEADLVPYAALELPKDGAAPSAAWNSRVADIMTRDVITVDENTPVRDVVVTMAGKRVKRVPVRSGRTIVGIVSRVDLLKLIASQVGAAQGEIAGSEDEQLRQRVLSAVRDKSWSLAERLDVVVQDGAIHLWGIVPNPAVLKAYQEAARAVPRARSVVLHMHIMPRGTNSVGAAT